jgi:hypothetical protein
MTASDFVTLRGGLTLPVAVIRLALDLEQRGLRMTVEDDGATVCVRPRDLLTDADRDEIRRWKPHLIALLQYDADASPPRPS